MARRKKSTETHPERIQPTQRMGETTAQAVERERIAFRAYELYIARGGTDGRDMDDWLEAEAELGRRQLLQASKEP
jgi:Protein of unknown function (DUF2934)